MQVPQTLEEQISRIKGLISELDSQFAEMRHETALTGPADGFYTDENFTVMNRILHKSLLLALVIINRSGQGHMASTASAMHIMAAVYFSRVLDFLRLTESGDPEVFSQHESHKPHAVPGWNGLLYLEGMLTREQMLAFRTFRGPNAYPTHEDPGIQVPTGSLGMGSGAAIGLAFLDQFNYDHGSRGNRGIQISIIGDSEFDEGVIVESIKERASHSISGWIEIIDYNRQSLDGNLDERLVDRIRALYEAYGINVIILKYGSLLQEIFKKPRGGIEIRRRLDALLTDDYQALLRQDGGVIRRIMTLNRARFEIFMIDGIRNIDEYISGLDRSGALPDSDLQSLLMDRTDREVKELFSNLGGHDLPMLTACIENVKREGTSAAVIAYTAKGWSIDPLLGSLSGHWKRLTDDEFSAYVQWLGHDITGSGDLWDRFPHDDPAADFLDKISESRKKYDLLLQDKIDAGQKQLRDALVNDHGQCAIPEEFNFDVNHSEPLSTQKYLGSLFSFFSSVGPSEPVSPLIDSIVTMAADVAFTAGLKDWVNTRGVWGPPSAVDIIKKYGEHPEMNVQPRRDGQHIRLSNLEQFLGLLAAAFGKSGDLSSGRRFPFAFFYDVFLERFAEMFKYAAYWDSAVWFIGTIAGSSAPGESGLHHGYVSGLIGRITPNALTWEPAFPLELNWIIAEELARAVTGRDSGRRVRYIRTTATPVRQDLMMECLKKQARFHGLDERTIYNAIRLEVLSGGYRLVDPSENDEYNPGTNVVNIFATGTAVGQAVRASSALLQKGIHASVNVITSPDLFIDKIDHGHIFTVIPDRERRAAVPVLTVTDSHPLFLEGIPARIADGRHAPLSASLGITSFDRSGTEEEIKSFHGIHEKAIVDAAVRLIQ